MADASAEAAFLNSMQDPSESAPGPDDSYDPEQPAPNVDEEEEDDDYDPSSLLPEISEPTTAAYDPDTVIAADSVNSATPDVESRTELDEDVAKVDGDSKPKGPRTVGGFVVDDDDDDDDDDPMAKPKGAVSSGLLSAARAASHTPQRSLSHTPNPSIPATDVSLISKSPQVHTVTDAPPSNASDATLQPAPATTEASTTIGADTAASTPQQPPVAAPSANGDSVASPPIAKSRLPRDVIGNLEDKIRDDPRGEVDSWLELIAELRRRNKLDEARAAYDRFFKVFPLAGEQWNAYAQMELQQDDFFRLEKIFSRALMQVPNVQLWSTYLDYVRRRNNLVTDTSGQARQTVTQTYEFVLQNVGIDKDSGPIWQDFVRFVKSGPGNPGGASWQDQQKMDSLRKAYQRAIAVPSSAVTGLWKEYDSFEMGLNKMTGRKFLQERSPTYMTARSSYLALQNIVKDLRRTTLPRLPPLPGFSGDEDYKEQVTIWKKWIEWEKEDPLVLKDEDLTAYRARILYVYKQALMALRFWPEMWYEAAEFCYENNLATEGTEFLKQGTEANPESCLLAFKRADRIERTTTSEDGEESMKRRGEEVREPFEKVLNALYELINQTKQREANAIAAIKESFQQQRVAAGLIQDDDDNDDDEEVAKSKELKVAEAAQFEMVQNASAEQIRQLSRTISFAWVGLMRAMRRIQGKGKPNDVIGGSRQIFRDARKRGRLTSDVYIASALIEYHCYKDPAATKIFERGVKLFPEDEQFALEYLKHLIAVNDVTNARAVFETTVSKLASHPKTLPKAKPIYAFFHEYESHYGELSQVTKLEKRMAGLFPDDPRLSQFAHRFSTPSFDPTTFRPIISPVSQTTPIRSIPTIEQPPPTYGSPRQTNNSVATNSPKRPLLDDFHPDDRPQKYMRGESPLKGAAGRRLDAHKRRDGGGGGRDRDRERDGGYGGSSNGPPVPAPLPREINFLLSIIPPASAYNAVVLNVNSVIDLLRNTEIPRQVNGHTGSSGGASSNPSGTSGFRPQPPQGYTFMR